MQSKLSVVSLAIGVVAIGAAVFAVMENRSLRAELEANNVLSAGDDGGELAGTTSTDVLERLSAVEADVARVEQVATTHILPGMPTLEGRDDGSAPREIDGSETLAADGAVEKVKDLVDEAVDVAVEKKAQQFRRMQDKKPSLEVFAEVLGLDEEQRAAAQAEILRGQRDIRTLLETPTEDGTLFLDELVEVVATSMAKPKEAQAGYMKLFGRLMSERVPGTNETYAARAEAVKSGVRSAFQRDWSESQYELFESWKMDPTEVQNIEGSPWKDLEGRIRERAREMGVDLPEKGDD